MHTHVHTCSNTHLHGVCLGQLALYKGKYNRGMSVMDPVLSKLLVEHIQLNAVEPIAAQPQNVKFAHVTFCHIKQLAT